MYARERVQVERPLTVELTKHVARGQSHNTQVLGVPGSEHNTSVDIGVRKNRHRKESCSEQYSESDSATAKASCDNPRLHYLSEGLVLILLIHSRS